MKLTTALAAISIAAVPLLAGCERAADVASRNLSEAADNFEINRRVVFYNGITADYILVIEGRCSLSNSGRFSVTCMTGPGEYKKHYLGLSDNVTYFAEQLDAAEASTYHYRVMFRPQTILPDIDFQADPSELGGNANNADAQ